MITGAALIIVAVFLGFAGGDLVMFQQMGFGVAVALLMDATLMRSVIAAERDGAARPLELVPARWLEWLPRVQVEAASSGGHQPAAPEPR